MTRTQRILIPKAGAADVLRLEEIDVPSPAAGQVRIAVEAGGVAFADIMLRAGVYPGHKPPATPGYDVVGRVDALGAGVTKLALGQRVAALLIVGGYATHALADVAWVVPAPEAMPAESIAAAILNYTTAYQMLTRSAQVERGDAILVHGAGGGVGTALLDLARHFGLVAWGTASPGKHTLVRQLGGTPIDYTSTDFVATVQGAGGVQAAFDHVGGAHLVRSIRALRPSGVAVTYGAYSVLRNGRLSPVGAARALLSRVALDPLGLLTESRSLIGYSIGVARDHRARAFREDFAAVMALLAGGHIQPVIDQVFPLAEASAAQRRLERATAAGKIVLRMSDS